MCHPQSHLVLQQCRLVGSDLIVVRLESTFGPKIVPAVFNPRPKELWKPIGSWYHATIDIGYPWRRVCQLVSFFFILVEVHFIVISTIYLGLRK